MSQEEEDLCRKEEEEEEHKEKKKQKRRKERGEEKKEKRQRQSRKGLSSFRSFALEGTSLSSYVELINNLLRERKLLAVKMSPIVCKMLLGDHRDYTIYDQPVTVHSIAPDNSIISLVEDMFFDECMFKNGDPKGGKKHFFQDMHGKSTFECEMDKGILKINLRL